MLRFVGSLLLAALALTGCATATATPEPTPTPLALVTEAAQNIRQMKTFRMLVEQSGAPFYVDTDLGKVQFRRAEAQYVAPRDMQAHVRLLALGIPAQVDVFSRGDNQWFRNSVLTANRWFNAPFSPGFNPENLIASENGFQSALEAMEQLTYVGIETLEDGSTVYHLKAKANGPDITALLAGLVQMTGNVDVDVYINKDKKLPARFIIVDPNSVTKKEPKPTTWTMDLYDFNALADIEDPEAATVAPIAEVTEAARNAAAKLVEPAARRRRKRRRRMSASAARSTRNVNPWLALALVCLPVFIGALDLTIVSAFLPEIIVGLELPIQTVISDASWVVNGYLLAYTVSMMFMGRVSDLIGRRKTYIACLLIFIVGSIIVAEVDPAAQSGLANVVYRIMFRIQGVRPDPGMIALATIIFGRIIQALGAGALVPVSLALVGDLFPPERRAQPLGIIGAVDTLGWVLGHLYGGILVNYFNQHRDMFVALFQQLGLTWDAPDWRALFWINVPITLIALVGTWWVLRGVPQERKPGRFDLIGTFAIVGALIALVVGLGGNVEIAASAADFKDLGGLPSYAGPLLLLAALLLIAFIWIERRVRDPLFDLRMFRKRNFSAGLATNLFVGFCLMIGLISVPILVNIRVEDTSNLAEAALHVGILLSALTVPMALAAIPGGWMSERFGYNRVAAGGLLLALIGFLLIGTTWNFDIPDATVAVQMALIGVGLGLTFSPISAAVINATEPDRLGVASALVIILRLVGMTVSVALLTAFASQRLAYLGSVELGTNVSDAMNNVELYAHLTVRVLAEIGLVGAAICAIGLIPALLLRKTTRPGEARANTD